MKLVSLETAGFRNLAPGAITFADGVNLLVGSNAAGKTNTLECACCFATGRSFRTRAEKDMIAHGSDCMRSVLTYETASGIRETMTAALAKDSSKGLVRRLTVGGCEVARMSEFLGNFRAVLFTPDHLALIKGSPEERRRFLDMALSQIAPPYVRCMNRYLKVTGQKNAYLRKIGGNGKADMAYLDTLNREQAKAAAPIIRQRQGFLELLCDKASAYYSALSGRSDTLEIRYLSALRRKNGADTEDAEEILYTIYHEDTEAELKFGYTIHGPQKDDLAIFIAKSDTGIVPEGEDAENAVSEFNARSFGSQGEQRSAVLAMKLAEGQIMRELTGEYPVFLLDDLLGELDKERKAKLMTLIADRQAIITCCDRDAFPGGGADKIIRVENGHFTEET